MRMLTIRLLVVIAIFGVLAMAQPPEQKPQPQSKKVAQSAEKPAKKPIDGHLVRVETVTAPSELADGFLEPLRCDNDGNVYFRTEIAGAPAIHKLNAKGERIAVFEANSNPNLKVDAATYFAIDPNSGELYELVYPHEIHRYVYTYKSDGTFKSAVKLQPGFAFFPDQLAVFPSGQFLVSGSEYDKDKAAPRWPFTGIFAADGSLLKEFDLGDEKQLHDLAVAGDERVVRPGSTSNLAVANSRVEMGGDGNAYLMRWGDPATIYAISPGGEVVRRFTVDSGETGYLPSAMHVYKNRIAILFVDRKTHYNVLKVMKIVDLEGHEIATYDEAKDANGKPRDAISASFACYTENPTRFLSLGTDDNNKVQFWIAEPR
jgi:hypothetical protein